MEWALEHRDDPDATPPAEEARRVRNGLQNDPYEFWAAWRLVLATLGGQGNTAQLDELRLHAAKQDFKLGDLPSGEGTPRLGRSDLNFDDYNRLATFARQTGCN